MAIPLINAFIRLRPDTTGFKAETETKLASLSVKIKLEPDLAPGFRVDLQDKVNKLRNLRVNVSPNLAAGFRRDLQASIDALRGVTFPVKPVMDARALAAFRAQYRLFEAVYLRDRSFLVGPTFDPNSLRLLQIIMRDSGTRSGNSFLGALGKVFKSKFTAIFAAAVPAANALLSILPILGELATASGALAASLPALLISVIAPAVALKLAFSGIGDAVKEAFTGDDPKKLEEALKKLAPPARAFVLEMASFKPQLSGLQQAIQANFFAPLVGGFKALAGAGLIPQLREQLGGIATDAGKAGRGMLDILTAGVKTGEVNVILSNARGIFASIAAVLPGLVQSFLTLASHAGAFGSALGGGVAGGLQKFNDLVAAAAKDGRLDKLFADGLVILKLLGSVLADIGSILKSVFTGLTAGSEGALGPLSVLLDTLADFLKTAEAQEALKLLGQTLNALGEAIGGVLKPLLPVVAQLAGILGSVLSQAILDLAPALGAFAGSLAKILTIIITTGEPILRVLVSVLSDFLVKAITEVSKHMDKMAPILEQLMAELGPALIPVVEAFGDALLELVPIIPEISDAIFKLVPILLELTPVMLFFLQMAANNMKFLAVVIREVVVPVVSILINVLVFLVEEIVGLVKATGPALTQFGNFFKAIWQGIVDFTKGAITAIKEEWHTWQNAFFAVRDWFASVIAAIRGYWNAFIGFLTGTIWPGITGFVNLVIGGFTRFRDGVANILNGVINTASSWWNSLRNNIFNPLINFVTTALPNAFGRAADLISTAFGRVTGFVRGIANGVIGVINGVINAFNVVARAVGVGTVGNVGSLAAGGPVGGGGGGGGGPQFARDGKLIEPQRRAGGGRAFPYTNAPRSRPGTIRGPGGGREDRVPLWASAGEFVVNTASTKAWRPVLEWINRHGMRGVSKGPQGAEPVGRAMGGPVQYRAGGGIIDSLTAAWDAITNPAKWVGDRINGLINKIPGAGIMRDIGVGAGKKLVGGLIAWIKKHLSFGEGGAGPGFGSWPSSPGAQRGDSGVWRSVVALIKSTGPISGSFGNAYRPGDPLWHGSGRAVDWMGFNQDVLASFLASRRPLELIHRTNSRDYAYTRGVNKGSFNQTLMNQHRNHIHAAFAEGGFIGKMLNAIRLRGGGSVLPAGSVRRYDNGGAWPNNTVGVNTSGATEHVTSADKMDRLIGRVNELVKLTGELIATTAGVGMDVGREMTGGAAMLRRQARAR